MDSKQQLLLATPQTWAKMHPKIPLEFLQAETIANLMSGNVGVQSRFVNNLDFPEQLYRELDYLERDGRFEENLQEEHIRQDKTLTLCLKDMDKHNFKSLYFICHILSALPYELNVKTQVSHLH